MDVGGEKRVRGSMFDDGVVRSNRLGWHRDTVFTRDICKGSMLRMIEVSAHEGETMLADTARAMTICRQHSRTGWKGWNTR